MPGAPSRPEGPSAPRTESKVASSAATCETLHEHSPGGPGGPASPPRETKSCRRRRRFSQGLGTQGSTPTCSNTETLTLDTRAENFESLERINSICVLNLLTISVLN